MSQHRTADWVTLSGYVVNRISPSGAAVAAPAVLRLLRSDTQRRQALACLSALACIVQIPHARRYRFGAN